MSTDYRFDQPVTKEKLLKAVKYCGLKVHRIKNPSSYCITDGENYIWFYIYDDHVSSMSRYGGNYLGEGAIIATICDYLRVGYMSEYDQRYWDKEDGGAA